MPPRAAIVEEFDDDTDLPLPNQPLPNTGTRGPLLEEIASDDDDDDYDMDDPISRAGPASPSSTQAQFRDKNAVTDMTPYKTCVFTFQVN